MSDTPQTPDVYRIEVIRQDIADPDKAAAELHFHVLSDGDIEMTVTWGDPPRDRGAYLIPPEAGYELSRLAFQMINEHIETRRRTDPVFRAYIDGDMETWRRLRAKQRTE